MKKPCFNVIFEDENITIPEIDDTDFLNFSFVFIRIYKREVPSEDTDNLKIVSF